MPGNGYLKIFKSYFLLSFPVKLSLNLPVIVLLVANYGKFAPLINHGFLWLFNAE